MVYFAKQDVYAYLKANNLIDESTIEEGQLKEVKPVESTPGKQSQIPEEKTAGAAENPLEIHHFSKELSLRVESAVTVHKEALKRLQETEDKLIKTEQSRVTWKINAFWSIATAVVGIATLAFFLMKATKTSSELSKNYNDITTKYEDAQDKLVKAKEDVLAKEEMLMKLQNKTQVTNATGN